jgi:hypothetical protein
MRPNLPSQTAHRAALPDLRLSERSGIVVSSQQCRCCSSIHPLFAGALHEPVRSSNACSLRRSRSPVQLNVGNRLVSKGRTKRYEGLWRSKAGQFLDARLRLARRIVHTQSNLDHSRPVLRENAVSLSTYRERIIVASLPGYERRWRSRRLDCAVLRTLSQPPHLRFWAKAEKPDCHKRAAGSPQGAKLHKRSAEASGFDSPARLDRTGHKERTPWLVG